MIKQKYPMKNAMVFLIALQICLHISGQQEIRLLVRGDDIGSTHAANLACIDAYQKGIVRSVEIMVPCAWFEEAVILLNQNPGLDIGIHLVLTSEWNVYKWRPLTHCPSITDDDGYFFPMIWPNENYPENRTLLHANWKIEEVEAELRAQIELALKKIPRISHLSNHMAWSKADPKLSELYERLQKEYNLELNPAADSISHLGNYDKAGSTASQEKEFIDNLKKLTPGTWIFVEHPAYDQPEMQGVFHTGYENVGKDRDNVARVLMSSRVKKVIADKKINLIGYKDL
jgi:chitin disaccharide deacetylase